MNKGQISEFLKNWHTMRLVGLAIGVFLAVSAITGRDALTGLFSLFFLFQAITNTGCFGAAQCGIPESKSNISPEKDFKRVEYEEIK